AVAWIGDAAARPYTLPDLKSLVAKKSYGEAVQHLTDVAPADRGPDWLDVAASASAGWLATLPADTGAPPAPIDSRHRDFPELVKVRRYAAVRRELGPRGVAGCLHARAVDACVALALRFVDRAGGDAALALRVAKLARTETTTGAIPLFRRALGAKGAC